MPHAALFALLLAAAPVDAWEAVPLSDEELAGMTGKFLLPSGASIAMSVTSDTLVDGQLVLRSVLNVTDRANLAVFGGSGEHADAPHRPANAPGMTANGVTVLFDRQSGMRTIMPTYAAPAVAVNVGAAAGGEQASVVAPLSLAPGMTIQTPAGMVSLAPSGNNVSLHGDGIDVTHVMGPAFATAIANTVSDRTIDTVTSIDLDLTQMTPLTLGGARLGAGELALDATRGLMR
ncbi:hypothetical protein [Sphingomonas aracearum]|uniref:Uncharacterized protein n=1 Tax=Sphingomonas aracearum TaxID=2283317 RepID=A0A369VXG4_9SPHN|nr:hypothetical protein [Sphingomonas aracearum]RDE06315.1 hypothetical protein DVW87_00865 [Sphingomonas aracearum]